MTYKSPFLYIVLILMGFLWSLQTHGQRISSLSHFSTDTFRFTLGGNFEGLANSNAITGSMQYAALNGSYLNRETRLQMLERASNKNRSGYFLSGSVYFGQKIDTLFKKPVNGFSYFVNVANRYDINSTYSYDLLNLFLFGNKSFAGKTAEMDGFMEQSLTYQQFQVGFLTTIDTVHRLGVGISYLNGQQNQQFSGQKFALFTSTDGDLLRLDAQATFDQTDTGNIGFLRQNGWGLSIDIHYQWAFNMSKKESNRGHLTVELNDLGFIKFNGNSDRMVIDTSYTYTGIEIEDVFRPTGDENTGPALEDISKSYKGHYSIAIPATVRLELQHRFGPGDFAVGSYYRFWANFSPYFYGKAGYWFNDWLKAGLILNYGGYGKFGAGLDINFVFNDFEAGLGSWNLEGFLAPKKSGGQQLYFTVKFRF